MYLLPLCTVADITSGFGPGANSHFCIDSKTFLPIESRHLAAVADAADRKFS